MAFQPPAARDDAAWERRFENCQFDSDDPDAADLFHNFKKRFELSLRASRTVLVTSPKPADADPAETQQVKDAATYQRAKWDHYQLLFHNALAGCISGSQLATVIIAAGDGQLAWEALCNKNESKHTISAVGLIYRLISVI